MESSGESVNCYYGAYLWSTVRWEKKPEYVDFTRLLLAMELRSVKTYWHMVTPDRKSDTFHAADIYNPHFAKNLMVRCFKDYMDGTSPSSPIDTELALSSICRLYLQVGNVGMMDVTVATWFGTEPLYVHMINYLPVTAVTRELFEKR